jgi:hypothetical protein
MCRQLISWAADYTDTMPVRPVGLSIPEELVVPDVPTKMRLLAEVRPGMRYTYEDQEEYYAMYRRACFAVTHNGALRPARSEFGAPRISEDYAKC